MQQDYRADVVKLDNNYTPRGEKEPASCLEAWVTLILFLVEHLTNYCQFGSTEQGRNDFHLSFPTFQRTRTGNSIVRLNTSAWEWCAYSCKIGQRNCCGLGGRSSKASWTSWWSASSYPRALHDLFFLYFHPIEPFPHDYLRISLRSRRPSFFKIPTLI